MTWGYDAKDHTSPDCGFLGGESAMIVVGEKWWKDAACLSADPDMFFPEKGGSTREAKRVCASCPVRAECLEYALDNDERYGVWGGLSERERRNLRRAPRDLILDAARRPPTVGGKPVVDLDELPEPSDDELDAIAVELGDSVDEDTDTLGVEAA